MNATRWRRQNEATFYGPKPRQLHILRSADGLERVINRLRYGPLAIDTETTGLEWWKQRVGALNLAAGDTACVAIGDALGPMMRFVSDEVKRRRELAFHNAKFDMHMMRETFGLHIPYPVHDTAVQSFVVDNRGANAFRWWTKKPHSLKPLASVYIDPVAIDREKEMMKAIKARGGKKATKGDWHVLLGTEDEHLFTHYSAYDPWYTLQLHHQFIERIRYWHQPDERYPSLMSVYEREQWMILAFRDMEARGICASRDFLEQWRDELKVELDKRTAKLEELTRGRRLAKNINWKSWQQVAKLFYSDRASGGMGFRGHGTDAVTLLNLEHAIGPALVAHRETFKQWSSYANSLLEALTPVGSIHPTFRSTGARTGRTSCADPNLQQQTRVSGVRKAYHPRKGLQFRFADYEQVEFRFAAHFANDPWLVNGFNNVPGFDPHGGLAREMFGKLFDPDSQHRKFAKIVNFTKLFGGGENKVTEQLVNLVDEEEALAGCRAMRVKREPGINAFRTLARAVIARANKLMPGLPQAIKDEAKRAEKRGYMMNDFGGHRFMDDGDERWYAGFNTRVQGTAGIKAKEGLVNVYRERQLKFGDIGLLLLIHDEIVYETEGDPKIDRNILELMEDRTTYKVPIVADMKAGPKNWQDKEKVDLKKRKVA